jgi:hypothetical protein
VTVDPPATVVWLDAQPPDASQARALDSWGKAHGTRLAPPGQARPPAIAVDPAHGDDIERFLDRVHDALAARDADAADRALSAAESTLRAHPELPQAAWLMAEVERARSARFRRIAPIDDEAAERAWMRAEALDGGRVAGVGEQPSNAHPEAATVTVTLEPAGGVLWLDGAVAIAAGAGAAIATRAGPHDVRVTWDDATVWAGWVETPAGSSTLRVAVPAPPPCSAGDVGGARAVAGGVEATAVRCRAWIAALPGAHGGSVVVATCEAGRCGALLEWSPPASWTWAPPEEEPRTGWPSWATWGLVGVGAVVATGVVLVAAGAFQSAPTETRFVSGGLKAQ